MSVPFDFLIKKPDRPLQAVKYASMQVEEFNDGGR